MAEHTKGEMKVIKKALGELYIHCGPHRIADIPRTGSLSDEEREANAYFLAAAPALLAACEEANQCFKCKYGYLQKALSCPDNADAELPCAGYEEEFELNIFGLQQAIALAKE